EVDDVPEVIQEAGLARAFSDLGLHGLGHCDLGCIAVYAAGVADAVEDHRASSLGVSRNLRRDNFKRKVEMHPWRAGRRFISEWLLRSSHRVTDRSAGFTHRRGRRPCRQWLHMKPFEHLG